MGIEYNALPQRAFLANRTGRLNSFANYTAKQVSPVISKSMQSKPAD